MTNFERGVKAVPAVIHLGTIPLDVYQMPDGTYKLYADSVTSAIEEARNDLLRFLRGKSPQALPHKDYNLVHAKSVEVEGKGGFIKPIPVELATAYWLHRAIKNNLKAQALVQACMMESIERRADHVFMFKRTETEYNQLFGSRFESFLKECRQEIIDRRLQGDDLYLPADIN